MSSPALYWSAKSWKAIGAPMDVLLLNAKKLMQQAGLTNVVQSSVDVSGRTVNTHAAITFIKHGTDVTAIVMVAGSVGQEAKDVRAKLRAGLDKWTFA
jgi:hypothetical protein